MCCRLQVAPSGESYEGNRRPGRKQWQPTASLWHDSLHVTCGLTACTPGSAPGPTLGNEYGKTLPTFYLYQLTHVVTDKGPLNGCVCVCVSCARCIWFVEIVLRSRTSLSRARVTTCSSCPRRSSVTRTRCSCSPLWVTSCRTPGTNWRDSACTTLSPSRFPCIQLSQLSRTWGDSDVVLFHIRAS